MTHLHLTSLVHREDELYVALCPELDIASQGDRTDSAKHSLREALELLFETASASGIGRR